MDRLTHLDYGGWWAVKTTAAGFDERLRGVVVDRLAAYEGTGLEPEALTQLKKTLEIFSCDASDPEQLKALFAKIQSWAEADRDGRLAILPTEDYTFTVRGDIALGVIVANCRRANTIGEAVKEDAPVC